MEIKDSYPAIDRAIARVKEMFPEDGHIAEVFAACISDTLKKTIHIQEDGSVFVITGDIPAMWLRDSACQLLSFLRFAKEEPDIRELLIKLVERQMTSMDRAEKYACIKMMADNDAGTSLMHEGIHVDDPMQYTRPWFSWANSMYCELVMEYCGM